MDITDNGRLVKSFIHPTGENRQIHAGMPRLDLSRQPLSFFEFWPSALIYIPVVFQWLGLAIRYRGLSLPLVSNPGVSLSGMVGEAKSELFSKAEGEAKKRIAPWCLLSDWVSVEDGVWQARQLMGSLDLEFPLVAKPDVGCRGAGVQIIRSQDDLSRYIRDFPRSGKIVLQQIIPYEAEAGIFYIRFPGDQRGKIFSITLKYPPYVIGDGVHTLRQLIERDPRAGRLSKLYFQRHFQRLETVLPKGQAYRLAFAGSHSRGCIFRDGREFITPELEKAFDQVADGLPEFYYGRLDIRFRDIKSLMNGENYYILEVNGASSEAAHIWDARSSLKEVYRVLFYQYRTLFLLGWLNRRRGFRSPSIKTLIKAWWKERKLVRHYPDTE